MVVGLILTMTLVACSSDEDSEPIAELDVGGDVGIDAENDVGGDTGQADGGPTGCEYQKDCAADEICFMSTCEPAPECPSMNTWFPCVDAVQERFGDEYAKRTSCRAGYCQINCWRDDECAEGELCTDYGRCIEFAGDLTGEADRKSVV